MEARAFRDVYTPCTDSRNSVAAGSGILDPGIPISPSCPRAGKAMLASLQGANSLILCTIYDPDTDWICVIHSNGNVLVFCANEAPERLAEKAHVC